MARGRDGFVVAVSGFSVGRAAPRSGAVPFGCCRLSAIVGGSFCALATPGFGDAGLLFLFLAFSWRDTIVRPNRATSYFE